MLKRLFFALTLIFLLPASTMAATFGSGEIFTLSDSEVVEGNLYVGSANVSVYGDVNGDLYIGGSNIISSANVAQDANIAGGSVMVTGPIAGDARIAGGAINIESDIGGELMAAGGTLQLLSDAAVSGDAYVGGGLVILDGDISGSLIVSAGVVYINGSVAGPVKVYADEIYIGKSAELPLGISYSVEPSIGEGAIIGSAVLLDGAPVISDINVDFEIDKGEIFEGLSAFFWTISIVKLLAVLTLALLLVGLLPKLSKEFVNHSAGDKFGWQLLRGLAMFIAVPIIVIAGFITVIGSGASILLIGAQFMICILARAGAGVILGAWIFNALSKKKEKKWRVDWISALCGVLLLTIIGWIPILGWILAAVLTLAAMGTLWFMVYQHVWLKRV